MDNWFVLNNATSWLMGVIHQGKRVLELNIELSFPKNSDDFFDWAEKTKGKQSLRQIEEHFFIIAVNKAITWLLEAEKKSLINRGISKDFRKAANLGTQIRNMREHDLEYFQGKGNKQEAFETEVTIDGVESAGLVDASSTIITDEGYLIGGRVNLQAVLEEAQRLYDTIENNSIDEKRAT